MQAPWESVEHDMLPLTLHSFHRGNQYIEYYPVGNELPLIHEPGGQRRTIAVGMKFPLIEERNTVLLIETLMNHVRPR